jgi:murein DD-endopeptidase MepM/ murein hydrolase activator NlpD
MKNIITCLMVLFIVSGCATTSPQPIATTPLPRPYPNGIYHVVLNGQTLWSIAKAYNKDISIIIERNNIQDPSRIEVGQKIFIPGATDVIKGTLPQTVKERSRMGYIWPVRGRVISYFGTKTDDNVLNKGIDIEAEFGQVVVAARSGRVVFCDEKVKGLGKTIIIEHDNGYSTLYAHNSENLVRCGDYVKQNQPIAKIGNTGRAKKPSLHFQVRKAHKPQNPFYYLP